MGNCISTRRSASGTASPASEEAKTATTDSAAASTHIAMAAPSPALEEWKVEEPYVNLHCALGEGPYYEKATNTLRWVDIIKRQLHTVSLERGPDSVVSLALDTPPGVTADVEGLDPQDKILVGAKYGLALLDRKTGKYEYIAKFTETDNERLRSNDGAVDSLGRFWVGTMTDFGLGEVLPEGKLLSALLSADICCRFTPLACPSCASLTMGKPSCQTLSATRHRVKIF